MMPTTAARTVAIAARTITWVRHSVRHGWWIVTFMMLAVTPARSDHNPGFARATRCCLTSSTALRRTEPRGVDAELGHLRPQRVRLDREQARRAGGAVDLAAALG